MANDEQDPASSPEAGSRAGRGRPPAHPSLGERLAGRLWPRATAAPWRERLASRWRRWRRYWARSAAPPR